MSTSDIPAGNVLTVSWHRPTWDLEFSFVDEWQIPSRCFVDIGFRTLNPFNEEKTSEARSPISPVKTPTPDYPVLISLLSPVASSNDRNLCKRLFRRPTTKRPNPCCARGPQFGAYEAVRIEGLDNRIGGAIRDNRSESLL